MEDINKNSWFTNPMEQGFTEIYGIGNSTLTTNAENTSDNLNVDEENNKDNNNNFLNKKRSKPNNVNDYISEIKRLMKEGGLEKDYLFIKKKKYYNKNNNNKCFKENNNFNNNDFNNNNFYDNDFNNNDFYDNDFNSNDFNNNSFNNNNFHNNNIQKKKEEKKKEEKKKEIKPVKPIQQMKSLNEWYQKLNLLPFNNSNANFPFPYDDKNGNGIVKYYGANNNCCGNSDSKNNNYSKYYIYLREKNEFEFSINDKKIYEWKVTILCDSFLIGVGLADKNIVKKNKNLFLSDDEQFNNGVFCILNTYNKEFNLKEMRPWHCDDKNLVNLVANFPHFKNGRIINIIYNSNNKTLEFNSKKNKYIMNNVFPKGNDDHQILTPCVVFYYSGNEVQFSQLNIVELNN